MVGGKEKLDEVYRVRPYKHLVFLIYHDAVRIEMSSLLKWFVKFMPNMFEAGMRSFLSDIR